MNLMEHNLSGGGGFIEENTFAQATGARSEFIKELNTQFLEDSGNLTTINSIFNINKILVDGIFYKGLWVVIVGASKTANAVAAATARTDIVCTSPDFINWTKQTIPGAGNPIPYSLAVNPSNGKLLLFLGSNEVQESNDGINWTAVNRSGNVYALFKPKQYNGNLLLSNAVGNSSHLGVYDVNTNLQTNYTVTNNGTSLGNVVLRYFDTNGSSTVTIHRATTGILNAVVRFSTNLTAWEESSFFIENIPLPKTLIAPIDVVWNGEYYIIAALTPSLLGTSVANSTVLDKIVFFRSTTGQRFDFCGEYNVKNTSLINGFDKVSSNNKYSIGFSYSPSLEPIGNRIFYACGKNIYLCYPIICTAYQNTAMYSKYMNSVLQSKDNGATWDIVHTSFIDGANVIHASCIFGNPATGEIVISPAKYGSANPANAVISKSLVSAKQLRRVY